MNHPNRDRGNQDLGQPAARETGELNTQSGSRQGQDRLDSSQVGRHGQQMQGSVSGSPSADQADPARVGNRQEGWQQAQPDQQEQPGSPVRQRQPK